MSKRESAVSDKETGLNQLTTLLIAAVLMYNTNKEHAMSVTKIAQKVSDITDQYFDSKLIDRHLKYILSLTDIAESPAPQPSSSLPTAEKTTVSSLTKEEAQNRLNAIVSVIGGYIRCQNANKNPKDPKAPNLKKEYYFDPLLNNCEFNLIKGAVTANRYIHEEERNYLTEALHFLHPFIPENPSNSDDPDVTKAVYENLASHKKKIPTRQTTPNASLVLDNINLLYTAICNKQQLEITYGLFSEKYNTIKLEPDSTGPRTINPYALIWNNGQNYLIATDNRDVTAAKADSSVQVRIYHFRVDRICNIIPLYVSPKREKASGVQHSKPLKCAPVPAKLKPYFNKANGLFQEDRYRSAHPQMSFSDEHENETVLVNCSKRALSVLVDSFGQNGEFISGETAKTKSKGLNLPFPDGYSVRIHNVDYNGLKRLCLHMQDDLYVIEPLSLREEIIAELERKISIYKNI